MPKEAAQCSELQDAVEGMTDGGMSCHVTLDLLHVQEESKLLKDVQIPSPEV